MKEEIILNPITENIKKSLKNSKDKTKIAVPFISNFVDRIFVDNITDVIQDKKLITRFDEFNINSFNIPVLMDLLEKGFKIRYDNNIHLKLYIFDNESYITSSNFTKGGFEDNTELTVKIFEPGKIKKCNEIFENIWNTLEDAEVTMDLLEKNKEKYIILRKRESLKNKNKVKTGDKVNLSFTLKIQEIIDKIFDSKDDYSDRLELSYSANKTRDLIKTRILSNGFNKEIFYVPEGHTLRRDNLFYYFVYGDEEKLAGTGLREAQFKDAFEHQNFKDVISFIFPDSIGLSSWNLDDDTTYLEFCNGIFDFNIPQYVEALPIRIASYFYPDYFLPIFKLEHLQEVSEALGLDTDGKTKGDRLYAYNRFLSKKMKAIPYNNYIKSNLAYQIKYCVEIYDRMKKGESFEAIQKSHKEQWIKRYLEKGKKIIDSIK